MSVTVFRDSTENQSLQFRANQTPCFVYRGILSEHYLIKINSWGPVLRSWNHHLVDLASGTYQWLSETQCPGPPQPEPQQSRQLSGMTQLRPTATSRPHPGLTPNNISSPNKPRVAQSLSKALRICWAKLFVCIPGKRGGKLILC